MDIKKKVSLLLAVLAVAATATACSVEDTPSGDDRGERESRSEWTNPETEMSSKTEGTSSETGKSNDHNAGIDPEFKAAMDAYESFYGEYCDFMKKYAANPTDLNLLAKYADMLSKAEEVDRAFEKWDEDDLNAEEQKYYLGVTGRVMQMLADVAG